ncbi:hypothetical protein KFE25_004772 [Diacronema lutheri]|uniref:Vesicle transport protein n=2 Tax=Diacronema lutheri TaxID=2081491 RepID=A0A8J5XC74_DIALT|nr:hypothetical protein KFE25_004772 [Diacronema lutheri]
MDGSLREFALAHKGGGGLGLSGASISRSYSMGAAPTSAGLPNSLSSLRANLSAFGFGRKGHAPNGSGGFGSGDGRPSGGAGASGVGVGGWTFDWGAVKGKGGADAMPSLLRWGGSDGGGIAEPFAHVRRLRSFAVLMLLGGLNFAMAGLFLPLVLIRPAKFSLFFTLGNCLVLASFAALRGAREQAAQLLSAARLPFTLAYVGSMCLTLYSALIAHSYVLVVVSAVAQLVALCYYCASYLPGGSRALRLLSAMAGRIAGQLGAATRMLCCGRRRGGMLPL